MSKYELRVQFLIGDADDHKHVDISMTCEGESAKDVLEKFTKNGFTLEVQSFDEDHNMYCGDDVAYEIFKKG